MEFCTTTDRAKLQFAHMTSKFKKSFEQVKVDIWNRLYLNKTADNCRYLYNKL